LVTPKSLQRDPFENGLDVQKEEEEEEERVMKRRRVAWEPSSLLLLVLVLRLALEGSLDHVDKGAEGAEQSTETEGPALDADGVDEEVDLEGNMLAD
jgi:hypothetical protein